MRNFSEVKNVSAFWVLAFICLSCTNHLSKTQTETEPVIYPPPPAETRIQYLTSISSSLDIVKPQSKFNEFVFGKEEALPVIKPYGIHIHYPFIYICDPGIKGLEIIDLEKGSFNYFIPRGQGELQLPLNCSTDSEGNLYVADTKRKQVVVYTNELKYSSSFFLDNDARPTDLCVDDSGIWITAIDQHCIQHFSLKDYQHQASFPSVPANSQAYLYQPVGISVRDSLICVSDIGRCAVSVYDLDYHYRGSVGSPGSNFGQFTRPKGVDADSSGNIYAIDAAFENVQVFDPEGQLLMYFGGTYNGPGGMWLPAGLTIDYSCIENFRPYVIKGFSLRYLIFVTNQYGPDKISVYGFVAPSDSDYAENY